MDALIQSAQPEEQVMSNISRLSPRTAVAAELPDFVSRRVERFYNERVRDAWSGGFITHSDVRPGPNDVVLQSNDYLSIANHPDIVAAQLAALRDQGNGLMMSSVFLREDDPMHQLERELAQSLGYAEGMLAQSGYLANTGLLQSVAEERTPVYIDMLAHTSLWEGIRAAGAKAIPVIHNEPDHMRRQVLRNGPGVIVVDAVYSTTGALSPLADYATIATESGSVFIVDESHSLGTHGVHGEGLVAALGLQAQVHFVTASLAKTYACRAGFIACPPRLRDYLSFEAFPAIFSSGLLAHEVAAISASHQVIRSEGWRRTRLHQTTRRVRNALSAMGYPIGLGSEQIIAFEVGTEPETLRVRDVLEAHGVFGSVFAAPATAKNRALIRLTLNAGMTDAQIERLLAVCRDRRNELDPANWSASRRLRRGASESIEQVA
jgi:CAI-1 autoinducer synthase